MSLYVRVMTNFYAHRKTLRLRAAMGDAAFWVPPRLWAYAAENQPDGCFKEFTPDEIAMLIGYSGNASDMLDALLHAGFMDNNPLRIHDWMEHNAYHGAFSERAKKAAAARWGKDRTVPDQKGKDQKGKERKGVSNASSMKRPSIEEVRLYCAKTGLPQTDADWFFHKCEGNGWTNGGTPIKRWGSTISSWKVAGYMPSQKNGSQTHQSGGFD